MLLAKRYFLTLLLLLIFDGIWLGWLAKSFYVSNIGHLMHFKVSWLPVALFYLLYTAGILFFVLSPAQTALQALFRGAFLGALCYAAYNFTNQATLQDWPWIVTCSDLAWGTGMTASVSFLSKKILS